MKGLIRGAAGLAVVLAMSACNKDETVDLMGPPTGIQATPVSAFTLKGDSVAILLRLVNDRNQAIPAEFTIGSVGPALSVAYDANYRPDYTNGDTLVAPAIKPQQRYFAKGANIGKSTFTASSGGFTTTVTVVVRPKTLENALSKTTGLTYGDTITITAPAGVRFTPTSAVTFATGPSSIASRSADSTSIKVVLGPGTGGIATITNTFLDYAPTLALATLVTGNAIAPNTPALAQPTLSATTGLSVGSVVTITAAPGTVFSRTPVITFPTGSVAIQSVSADSTSVNIVIGPGVSGPATITKMGIVKAPAVGVFTVTTTNSITAVPAVTSAPTTVSNAAPSIGAPITVTLGGSLRFLGTSRVTIGGVDAAITAISADSSTATITPSLGSTGAVSYVNIALSFLTGVPLSVPSDGKTVAPTATYAGSALAGGTTLANAPEIALPTVIGLSTMLTDQGPFGTTFTGCTVTEGGDSCRLYKIVVPAGRTYTVTGRWDTSSDIGIYRFNDVGGGAAGVADALGQDASRTETGSLTNLAAGTYYLALVYYGPLAGYAPAVPVPTTVQLKITRTN